VGDNFDSGGGEQNIAQGDKPIGKQVNNYFSQPLKPRTVLIASLAAAGVMSGVFVGYDYFARKQAPPVTKNSTSGPQSPAIMGNNATVNYGVPLEKYEQTKKDLDVSDAALVSFFKILEQGNVPREEWSVKLPEIALRYKELLQRFEAVTSDDPQVQALKGQAKQAIENGEYDRADALLNQAKEHDRAAVATLKASLAEQQAALEKRQLSEAASCVDQARLQDMQYHYAKAVKYWQEAAAIVPEEDKKDRAYYLGAAGYDLYRTLQYAEALRLDEQSLALRREIGDRQGEGWSLNNIGHTYLAQRDYGKASEYLKQSLRIRRETGDKRGEGVTLNNLAAIAYDMGKYKDALGYLKLSLLLQREIGNPKGESATLNSIGRNYSREGDYITALKYFRQSLAISQEIGEKHVKVMTLGNIGEVLQAQGKLDEAFKQLEQSLDIAKEIGDKDGEAGSSGNIGVLYTKQGKLTKAEPYLSRAVELGTQLERPDLQDWREALEIVRAKLRGQQ
jgi:tetratricopeptide (TPR) repeat protein